MQKNFTKLIAHFLSAKRYTVPAGALFLFIATSLYIWAAIVPITPQSVVISADKAANGPVANRAFTALVDIVIREGDQKDFKTGSFTLAAPTGWVFNPNGDVSAIPNSNNIIITNIVKNATSIVISFNIANANTSGSDQIIIGGVEVQALDGGILYENSKVILSSNLTGIGLPATVANLSQNFGAAVKVVFTTQPVGAVVNTALSTQPKVAVQDWFGNTVTSASGNINLALIGNPSTALFASGGTATLTNGVAQFNNVSIDEGGDFQLLASYSPSVQGTSSAFVVNNKVPAISEAGPCMTAGSEVNTITVTGTNFVRGSVVRVNGSDRGTTFVNSQALYATLEPSDINTAQTLALTVFNPTPAGGSSGSINFVIHPVYNVGSITGDAAVCENTQNVTYSVEDIGAAEYSWTVGSGATFVQSEDGNSITVDFGSSASTVNISVVAINACGERGATSELDISVTPQPVDISAGADRDVCSGKQTTLGSGEPAVADYIYAWAPADETSPAEALSSTTVPNPTLTLPENNGVETIFYSYTLTVKNKNNTDCQIVDEVLVGVYPEMIVAANDVEPVCVGGTIELVVTGDDDFNYAWTGPDGFTSNEQSPEILNATEANDGVYTVTVTNLEGCEGTDNITVNVVPLPTADAGEDDSKCAEGASTSFAVSGTATGGAGVWSVLEGTAAIEDLTSTSTQVDVSSASATLLFTVKNTDGCTVSDEVVLTVDPLPVVEINGGEPVAYFCFPGVAMLSATFDQDYDYEWFRVAQEGETEDQPYGTTQDISVDEEGEYYVVVTDGKNCSSPRASISVQKTILGNNIVGGQDNNQNQEICYGAIPEPLDGEAATSTQGDVTYKWQSSTDGENFTNMAGSASTVEDLTLGSLTATTWYRRLATVGFCADVSNVVQVTVKPELELSSDLTPDAICSGGMFRYTPTSVTTGATFSWTRAAVEGISNAAVTTPVAGNISEVLTNTTAGPINVIYSVVTAANGCSGTAEEVKVVVNPTPQLSNIPTAAAICSGASFSYEPASNTDNASFSWKRAAVEGISEEAVTTPAAGKINEVLTNTTSAPINVTYSYTTTANGCPGTPQDVVVTVNPSPALSSALTANVCTGNTFTYAPTSATAGATFSWTRAAVTGISNAAVTNGTGGVSETLVNTTTAPINVTYVYTTSANSCPGTPQSVVVTVNPSPALSSALTANVCTGNTFTYAPTSATAGATFSWTRAAVTGISNAAVTNGTGGVSETLVNTTTAPINVTYVYTTSANSCPGTPQSVVVTVNPSPALSSALTANVCTGNTFTYAPTSATAGATFFWTRAASAGNPAASGEGAISEVLTNTTTAPVNVTYSYTTTANGCPGTPQDVVVTVNPRPVLSSTLTSPAICSGATFSYTPTSATAGVTFSWARLAATGITSNGGTSGTGGINQTLTNSGTAPVEVTYRYTTSANGCTGNSTEDVKVTINPTPKLSSTQSPAAVCSGSAFNYSATSATANTTFSWSRAAVTGISNAAVSNVAGNVINETLINTTANPINVVYEVNLAASGCTNKQSVTVSISPNQAVSFTGTIANINTFYTGQGAVALSANPTGGVFSSPKQGAVTLSNGVYSFNPCAAGAGTHTITYTRTTGSCTSTVSKTVTVIQSTYRAVITANPHPFCRGGGGTEYTTVVYRDVQPGEIIYPYLVNANGDPVDAAGNLIPKGGGSYPVPNPDYPYPAGTPESITAMSFRFFQPIVSDALAARKVDPSLFSYQWGKNDEQNRKNDDYVTSDAGLSSQDYYEVEVTSTGICSQVVLESNRMYSAVLESYTVAITAAPNPICQGAPVTFTATLGAAFPWNVANLQMDFVLERGNVVLNPASFTYTDAVENKITFTTDASTVGGFVNGDKVFARFSTNILPYLPSSNCIEGPTSTPVTIQVNDIAVVQNPAQQNPVICLGGQATFTAPVTTTGPAIETYTWTVGARTYATTEPSFKVPAEVTGTAGSYPVRVVVSNICETTSTLALGTLTVKPALTVFTVSGNDSFCAGSPRSFPITLSGSQTGVNYTLLRGTTTGTTTVQTIAGTGSSLEFTAPSRTGTTTYTISAGYTTTPTCTVGMSGSATITEKPLPTVTVNSPTTCSEMPVEVIAVPAGGSGTYTAYTWTVPAGWVGAVPTTASFQTTVPGTYTVKVADDRSCQSSAVATSIVTVNELPTVTVTNPTVCAGDLATVTATPSRGTGPYSYTWTVPAGWTSPTGATNPGDVPSFQTATGGEFKVSVTDSKNCASSLPATGTVTVNALVNTGGVINVSDSAGVPITDTNPIMPGSSITITTDDGITNAGVGRLYTWYIGSDATGTWGDSVTTSTNSLIIEDVKPGEFDVKVEIKPGNSGEKCFEDLVLVTSSPLVPLPVAIIYLNASKQGNDVVLEWATAMEEDNAGFEVQVSTDGFNYRKLTFVAARNGNSNMKQEYTFTDKENGKSGTRYYRLKQIDTNGTFEFFGPKAVTFGSVASKVIAFPNPFHDEMTLDIAAEANGEALITVTDAVGKKLLERKVQVEKGFTTEKLHLDAGMPRGLYIIKTEVGGFTQYIKMIKE